jgi:hypothetical protein
MREKGIAWPLLRRTFQHAIITTYGLGIKYLWIDSLSILQGDEKDWETESAEMGPVYEN